MTEETEGRLLVSDLVEKPESDQAPSDLAICGRYVFSHEIFTELDNIETDQGGEIQLTDAIAALAASDKLVQAVPLAPEELRLDVGNFSSYGRAFVRGLLAHSALGPDFHEYVLKLAAHLQDSSQPEPDRA